MARKEGMTRVGWCEHCGPLQLLCPNCGFVFGITHAEYDESLRCGWDCGRVYKVNVLEPMRLEIETHDHLGELLLPVACKNTMKRITAEKVQKSIQKTK